MRLRRLTIDELARNGLALLSAIEQKVAVLETLRLTLAAPFLPLPQCQIVCRAAARIQSHGSEQGFEPSNREHYARRPRTFSKCTSACAIGNLLRRRIGQLWATVAQSIDSAPGQLTGSR